MPVRNRVASAASLFSAAIVAGLVMSLWQLQVMAYVPLADFMLMAVLLTIVMAVFALLPLLLTFKMLKRLRLTGWFTHTIACATAAFVIMFGLMVWLTWGHERTMSDYEPTWIFVLTGAGAGFTRWLVLRFLQPATNQK